ncbi:MAG: NUMOD3 domain-containing DNA-binding protein, partial [Patescibacteria group bacterium]
MPFQKGHGRLRSLESYKTQDKSFMTPEYKNKISELAKSKNYGKWMIGKKLSPETRIKISNANKGKNCGEKNGMVGFEFTEEYRRKLSERSPKGEKCNFWKGGVLPINTQIRSSFEYKQWRRLVFERDNYTCQKCGK